jgi:hypothetical protein
MAASISPMGVPAPKALPKVGKVSSVGQTGAAPKPRGIPKKNTRDYGKPMVTPQPQTPPSDPFGITDGSSRLGGI